MTEFAIRNATPAAQQDLSTNGAGCDRRHPPRRLRVIKITKTGDPIHLAFALIRQVVSGDPELAEESWLAKFNTEGSNCMKRQLAKLIGTLPNGLSLFAPIAIVGCLTIAGAVHAEATSTYSVVRGYQATSSTGTPVVLLSIPGVGDVEVNCPSGPLTGIAIYPTVSGSLWYTHGGVTTYDSYVSGSGGVEVSRQSATDTVTIQFATTLKTATIVISGEPGSPCIYSGQATIQD